ncbi:hypothetical protein GGF43_005521 [Coemansia sp. RSA 2618]|nr:hypothetical protein GGF43_005521 [Coemansia sp. RSA 2618]
MDTVVSTLVVWLIIGYPVLMSIFNRREYERKWVERLANDNNKTAYDFTSNQPGTTYAKMNDNSDSGFNHSNFNFDGNDTLNSGHIKSVEFADPGSLRTNSTLRGPGPMFEDGIPIAMRTNLQIRRPVLNSPSMFANAYPGIPQGGRTVL